MPRRLRSAGTRVLLIGTGRHRSNSHLRDIHSVEASLVDLKRELVWRCGLADDAVQVVLDPPDPLALVTALQEVTEQAQDALWVHFIGHGLDFRSTLHLATGQTIADEFKIPVSSVNYDVVRDALRDSPAVTRVVTLDCCFSGRAISMAPDEQATTLKRLTMVEHTYVLTATAGSQEAIAPANETHTAFTGALIEFLREGDPSVGPQLTLGDAHRFISITLADSFPMTPQLMEIGNDSESLVLAANPAYQAPPPQQPAADRGLGGEPIECPYPGTRAFTPAEAGWFFGRADEINELVGRLGPNVETGGTLVLRAAPGTGATSLLHAGLLPALAHGLPEIPQARHWLPILVGLGPDGRAPRDPLSALAEQLAGLSHGTDPEQLRTRIRERPRALAEFLHEVLRRRAGVREPDGSRVILIIDQYEEVFRLDEDAVVRTAFIEALAAACVHIDEQPPPALLLVAVHTGAPNPCGPGGLPACGSRGEFVLPALAGEGLRAAIELPAREVGVRVSPDLVRVLQRDLRVGDDAAADAAGDGRLPLLARALRSAWELIDGGTLAVGEYHRSGGIRSAAACLAEDACADLDADEQQAARLLLLHMIHIEDDATDGLRPVRLDDVIAQARQPATARRAADVLTRHHVIATTETGNGLLQRELLNWRRLRAWIDEDRAGLTAWQRLRRDATAWDHAGRDNAWLLTGGALADAERWKGPHRELLSPRLEDFLDASSGRHTSRLRRRVATLITVLAVIAGLAISAGGFAAYASRQQSNAVSQREIAESRRLAAAAAEQRNTNPQLAALLAVRAYSVARTTEAESSLLSTQAYLPAARITVAHRGLNGIAVTPDGRRFATADQDGTVSLGQVGNVPSTTTLPAGPHPAPVYGLAFSPDGRHLAGAHSDGSVDLWTVNTAHPALAATIRGTPDATNAVSFNADGSLLATAGDDGTLRLWSTAGVLRSARAARPVRQTALGRGPIEAAAFAPGNPNLLVTGNADTTATVISLGSEQHESASIGTSVTINCGTQPVDAVAISTDGKTLATGDDDGNARLWGTDGSPRAVLTTPATRIEAVAFSRDGDTLAAAGEDGGIRLWDTGTGTARGVLFGPAPHVNGLAFIAGPTGTGTGTGTEILAGDGSGGTVGLWSVATRRPDAGRTAQQTADTAVFGPPGTNLFATAGTNGDIQLWHVHDPTPFDVVHDPTTPPATSASRPPLGPALTARMAFSPDGSQLAFVGRSGAVVVWDLNAERHRAILNVSAAARRSATTATTATMATAVAYSPDGSMLVAVDSDRELIIWNTPDLASAPRRGPITNQLATINAIAFRRDGVLAAAGNDGTIGLTAIPPTRPLQGALAFTAAVGHLGPVKAIAFSPDGNTLASGGADLETRLWSTGQQPAPGTPPVPQSVTPVLSGHAQTIVSVAISPDGTLVASAGEDRTVMLWAAGGQHDLKAVLTGLPAASTAAFDPGDRLLATSDDEGAATFWSTDPEAVIRQICADHPTLTAAERGQFDPGQPFQDVCAP